LDSVHHQVFEKLEHTFWKLDLFPPSAGGDTPTLLGPLEKPTLNHSPQLLQSANLQSPDTLINFNVLSLFTNVRVDKALQVIRNKLHNDDTLVERSILQVEAIVELLEVFLRTTYFQVDEIPPIERWQGYGKLSITYH
jgi:hypothetical protein